MSLLALYICISCYVFLILKWLCIFSTKNRLICLTIVLLNIVVRIIETKFTIAIFILLSFRKNLVKFLSQ